MDFFFWTSEISGLGVKLEELIKAFYLWSGHAVAGRVAWDLLPLPRWGFLFQRSFLDSRVLDQLQGPCAEYPQLVVDHFDLKGIGWKVLSARLGSSRDASWRLPKVKTLANTSACHHGLLMRYPRRGAGHRCVLFITLPPDLTMELLELSLRLAAAQTRKPDEVVLVAPKEELFAELKGRDEEDVKLGIAELQLEGGQLGWTLRGYSD